MDVAERHIERDAEMRESRKLAGKLSEQREAFEAAADQWAMRGSRGRTCNALDKAPSDIGELAAYFASLKEPQLRGCWVSCLVHAAIVHDFTPGDVARALVVVAERLHGVVFEHPVIGDLPLETRIPKQPPAARDLRMGDPPNELLPNRVSKPPAAPAEVAGYQIFTGPPPDAKTKRQRTISCLTAAMALPVGGWFIWRDAKKTTNCKKMTETFTKECGFEVIVYKTVAGTVVVKRVDPAPKE